MWVHNPEYLSKIKRKVRIWNTPKKILLYTQDQDTYIAPFGFKDTLIAFLRDNNIEHELIVQDEPKHLKMNKIKDFQLRDYQQESLEKLLEKDNGILVSPAGSGKTRVGIALIGELNVKTLWITNKLDLVRQAKKTFEEFYSNKTGQIGNGKINIQDVTFATVQTVVNMDFDTLKDTFDLIITDEVHRVVGGATKPMQFYKVLSKLNAKYKYGLTATLFDKPNYTSNIPLLLVGEVLHKVDTNNVKRVNASVLERFTTTKPGEDYLTPSKTIDYNKQLDYLVNDDERNYKIIMDLFANKDNYNLVLSSRNEHLNILKDLLDSFGLKSELLTGNTRAKDREDIQERFKSGELHFILSNYQLAKEGLDLPIADRLYWVLPIRDKITTIQSAGRIERLHKNKKDAIIYDYIDHHIGNLIGMAKERRRHLNAR